MWVFIDLNVLRWLSVIDGTCSKTICTEILHQEQILKIKPSKENKKIKMFRQRLLLLLTFDDDEIVDLLFLIDLRKYFSLIYVWSPFHRETIRYDLWCENISQSDCWEICFITENQILHYCLNVYRFQILFVWRMKV